MFISIVPLVAVSFMAALVAIVEADAMALDSVVADDAAGLATSEAVVGGADTAPQLASMSTSSRALSGRNKVGIGMYSFMIGI
jgi:hypothetical protein